MTFQQWLARVQCTGTELKDEIGGGTCGEKGQFIVLARGEYTFSLECTRCGKVTHVVMPICDRGTLED